MACQLIALCIDANDPLELARFWAGLLGWQPAADPHQLLPTDDTGFRLHFLPTDRPKLVQNRMHFDLTSSSLADQQQTVARAIELGGRHIDIGQRPDEEHVVLADPAGNEFCVIEPGNNFLADCGFVGALACDGSQQVGYFWRDVLGWPLVWDQDQETAIRAPHGGPKITWGGPPLSAKPDRNRLHLDLAPVAGSDQQAEADRLLALGASLLDYGRHAPGSLSFADPDGNEFCLLAQR
jgi:catechol 2,3-dioxygenase-like lactoylglutathione lyase family enzyme